MEYPAAVIVRAKELWLEIGADGKTRSFDEVTKIVNDEFKLRLTRKTVHKWSQEFNWTRQEDKPAAFAPILLPNSNDRLRNITEADEEQWDWDTKKAVFLRELTGLSEDCLAAVRNELGKSTIGFRDAESAAKTALACLEAVGKINSGKYDAPEEGDQLPKLKEGDVVTIVQYFVSRGKSPAPSLRPGSIDVEVIP